MTTVPTLMEDTFVAAPPPPIAAFSDDPLEGASRPTLLVWLTGLYVFFLPIQFQRASINLAPSDIFLGATVFLCFFRLRFLRSAWSAAHLCLMLAFLGAAGTSVYLHGSISTYVAVKIAGLFTLFAAYLCLTTAADSWPTIRLLIRVLIFATSLHCLIAIAALKAGFSASWMNYGNERVSGMLLDPNAFGGLVLVALLLQIGSAVGGRAAVRGYLGIAVTATLSAGLFLTLSRSAWIGFSFGFILISFLRPRARVIGAFLIAVVAGGSYLWIESQKNASNEQLITREDTAMERVEQIRQALPMFTSHPILGVGLGEFDLRSDPADYHPLIIHNTTVWILTEMGLVGITAYIAFMAWFFQRGWFALRFGDSEAKPLVLGLLGAFAGMLGLSTGIEDLYQRHWWFVMALLAAAAAAASRDLALRRERNYED